MWIVVPPLALLLISLPYWLPARVTALRMWIFARINGPDGIPVPGPLVSVDEYRDVYAHPAADGRSRGAALSDLFWYWLSPGAHLHQEHLEPGPRYEEVARTTRRILAMRHADTAALMEKILAGVTLAPGLVRVRDLAMPVWAEYAHELVFGRPCTPAARDLIVAHATDVVDALKCTRLRHMDRRDALTRYIVAHLADVPHPRPAGFDDLEFALYLQGVFFTTTVVQMSDATAHLGMALAAHPDVQERLAADPDGPLMAHVLEETVRLYPLFGIAHRITSADIRVNDRTTIPAGSVLCFSYPEYHRTGFASPERFLPDRWDTLSTKDANHIPFGITANRPCPARGVAPTALRAVLRHMLLSWELATSAGHTRSLPSRGPVLLMPRGTTPNGRRRRAALGWLRVRDRWEDVWRSVVQLVLGSYMVWDARRQGLCRTYFA
ncbi:cytochrome P450 [Virgisporangium aliadipatigenens]|uniref:Cytochrome P450 n=1 Tax=Virgisporangium aliadipatigenens TaxID=741659 RepID=A0A8J3YPM8_9ACTN|nr:cytochrome P450 [Virgisporangium aliadipatigenens]GIJ49459.1 cytochrome P450 [Virgisporangium aliadipatigenens]